MKKQVLELNKVIWDNWEKHEKKIPDKSVNLVIMDPPFKFMNKQNMQGGGIMRMRQDYVKIINEYCTGSYTPVKLLKTCKRILKKFNGYFFTNKNLLINYITFAEKNKYSWGLHMWKRKNIFLLKNGWLLPEVTYIVFIWESGAFFNKKLDFHAYKIVHEDIMFNLNKRSEHPNEKPISMIKKFLRLSAREGDVVADFFTGSGTVPIACQHMKCNFIAFERNKRWKEDTERDIYKNNPGSTPMFEQEKLFNN